MTTPGGIGGGANLGTSFGTVRIRYESTGVAQVSKGVAGLNDTLADVSKSADSAGKRIGLATAEIERFSDKANKRSSANPAAGLGDRVSKEVKKAANSLGTLDKITLKTSIKVTPGKVEIERGPITKAINAFAADGLKSVNLKVPLKISPSDITLDRSGIENAIRTSRFSAVTVKIPVKVEPTDVSVSKGPIDDAVRNSGGVKRNTSSDSGGGVNLNGLSGALGLVGKLGIAGGAASAAIAPLALTLTKGFDRLQGLDAAAIKLKALGYNADQIGVISKTAEATVKGLSFGLDEAFATAADALNAGVPLQQLDKYLSATANTAALAGVGMQELGQALSETAISGKLSGDTLNLLVSRNVPVLKLLADEYHVTQAAAAQMVSNGEVDFGHLINALNKTGDAGRLMGNTVSGSFKNLGAQVGRIGALLLAPLFGKADGEASNFAKAIQFVTEKLGSVETFLKNNKDSIIDFWVGAGQSAIRFGDVVLSVAGGVVEGLGQIIKGIGSIGRGLAAALDFIGADDKARGLRSVADDITSVGQGVFDAGNDIFGLKQKTAKAYEELDKFGEKAKAAGDNTKTLGDVAGNAGNQTESLSAALEKLGVKSDEVIKALEGTNVEFDELIKKLEKKGATQAFTDALGKLRNEWTNGGRAAKSYADAIRNMSDSSVSANDKATQLISSLKQLGLLPGGDELADYNKQFNEMTSYMSTLADQTDTLGNSLVNLDGTINSNSNNGQKLVETLSKIQQSAYQLAASGKVAAGDVYDRTAQEIQNVLQQFGIAGDQADDIINKYLSPGGGGKVAFEAQFNSKDGKEALEKAIQKDPVKLQTALDLLTTSDQIVKELTGNEGSIRIPATIDLTNPDALGPKNNAPGQNSPASSAIPPSPPIPNFIPDPNPQNTDTGLPPVLTNVAPSSTVVPGLPNIPTDIKDPNSGKAADPSKTLSPKWQLVAPDDVGGLLGTPDSTTPNKPLLPDVKLPDVKPEDITPEMRKSFVALANDPSKLSDVFAKNPDIGQALQPTVDQAKSQGQNMALAFSQGILTGSEDVKKALLRLAALSGDYLGNSPAKYGPLSGKGWTLHRGKTFTKDWAKGIESESDSVASSVSGVAESAVGGMPAGSGETLGFDDKLTRLIKDVQEFSDLGKNLLSFGNQLADVGFGAGKLFNDLSGGRLFPKNYVTDKDKKPAGSTLPDWNPQQLNPGPLASNAAANTVSALNNMPGGGVAPPGNANGPTGMSVDQIASSIISQGQAAGLNPDQIKAALAVGLQETGLGTNPRTNVVQNQNGTPGIAGVFQQDNGYNKYGNKLDPVIAAKGFIDQYVKTGQGLNNPNPYDQALQVQRPARVGSGGYDDRGGPNSGSYLKSKQGAAAEEIYNRLAQGAPINASKVVDTKPQPQPQPQTSQPTATNSIVPSLAASGNIQNFAANQDDKTGIPSTIPSVAAITGIPNPPPTEQGIKDFVAQYNSKFGTSLYEQNNATHEKDRGYHPYGYAFDVAGNSQKEMDDFSTYLRTNYQNQLLQLIHQSGSGANDSIVNGLVRPDYYGGSTLAAHRDHVHFATDAPLGLPGQPIPDSAYGQPGGQPGGTTALLSQIATNTSTLPYVPQALSDFASSRPDLQSALALPGGSSQSDAVTALRSLDSGIADANKAGNKDIATSLGNKKTQLQGQYGLKEEASDLDKAQSFLQGASGIAGDIFAAVDAGLKYAGAIKDTADLAVRGIANTADINRLIDNVQTGIDLASKIFTAAGSITSFAGSFSGGTDFGGTAAAGQALSLIGAGLSAVNTGIDIGQEIYRIAGKYVGRALTSYLGFPGATDMNFLLDEKTGQLQAYTSENPQNKTYLNTLGREFGNPKYSGDVRPAPTNILSVYAGPGQDPRDTMNDAMFAVRSSGSGAFGYDS